MSSPILTVRDLRKVYSRPHKAPGLLGSLRALIRRDVERIVALDGVSWELSAGQILGYVGPNGAGKTTTLKIAAGVLYPTSGEIRVLGHVPWRRESAFLGKISLVMSGRGFLEEIAWDLSVADGLQFVGEIYRLPRREYQTHLDELVALLGLCDLLDAPLRQLSHGQRQRVELAGALLWHPQLLLLDEPTLGLDVVSQATIRRFVRDYVQHHDAACVITSHYMRDIEELADRVLLLDRGKIVAAGSPRELIARLCGTRVVHVELERPVAAEELACLGVVQHYEPLEAAIEVAEPEARRVARELLVRYPVCDIRISEPSLEDALQRYFAREAAS